MVGERRWAEYVQLVPFVDYGRAWNTHFPTPEPQTLASVGLGLRWAVTVPAPVAVRPEFEGVLRVALEPRQNAGGKFARPGA